MKVNKGLCKVFVIVLVLCLMLSPVNTFSAQAGSTIIDLTGLTAGDGLGHDCNNYLVTQYDSNRHWKQCSICGKKFNEESHSMNGYWTGGDSCASSNQYISSCSCGYKTVSNNTRAHTWVGWAYNDQYHTYWCSKCHAEKPGSQQNHVDAYGNKLSCGSNQNCAVCGHFVGHHGGTAVYDTKTGKFDKDYVTCLACGKQLADLTRSSAGYSISGNSFSFNMNLYTLFNMTSGNTNTGYAHSNTLSSFNSSSSILSSNVVRFSDTGTFNSNELVSNYFHSVGAGNSGFTVYISFCPDKTTPTCSSVTTTDLSVVNGWATKKQVNLSGTENFCKTVTITVKDSAGTVYVNNATTSVSNGGWNYSFVPNIEVNTSGKTFIATITDTFGNTSTKSFTLSKVDGKQPSAILKQNTSTDWSKTKNFTASCTDEGIGQVSSSVLNSSSFITMSANGTSFMKDYTFTGELYGSLELPVIYKDGAGNSTTTYLTVSNLDNTAPTITNAAVTKGYGTSTVTVTANDINTVLGKSGSGITGYGISTSASTQPATWQSSNVLSVTDNGTYYVWAKDAVGNMSSKAVVIDVVSKVSFDAQSGTCDISSKDYLYSNVYSDLPIPSRKGYTFLGWNSESDGSGIKIADGEPVLKSANVTAYAQWQRNEYTVTYDYGTNGGTSTSLETAKVLYEDAIDFSPIAEKNVETGVYTNENPDGWQFVGWNTDKNATKGLTSLKMSDSDVTLYAIYKKTIHVNFIDYNNETKQQQSYSKTVYNDNTTASFSEAVHHSVAGWNWRFWTNKTDAKPNVGVTDWTFNKDTDLYGCYEKSIIVTFVTDRKSSSFSGIRYTNSYDFEASKDPSIKAPAITTRYGWDTLGYSMQTDCDDLEGLLQAGIAREFKESCTMYAIYKKPVVLTYSNYNFIGTKYTQTADKYYNASGIEKPATFVVRDGAAKTGVEFKTWNTTKDGSGVSYSALQEINLDSDTTVYACFGKISGIQLSTEMPEITLLVNERKQLEFSSDKLELDNYDVTWCSNNTKIAEVSTDGIVSGISPGDVTVSITYPDDPTATLTYLVHVVSCNVSVPKKMTLFESEPVSISFSDNNANLGELQKTADLVLVSTGNLFLKKDNSVFFELDTFAGVSNNMQIVNAGENVLSAVNSSKSTDIRFQPKVNPNVIPSGEYQASATFQLRIR